MHVTPCRTRCSTSLMVRSRTFEFTSFALLHTPALSSHIPRSMQCNGLRSRLPKHSPTHTTNTKHSLALALTCSALACLHSSLLASSSARFVKFPPIAQSLTKPLHTLLLLLVSNIAPCCNNAAQSCACTTRTIWPTATTQLGR